MFVSFDPVRMIGSLYVSVLAREWTVVGGLDEKIGYSTEGGAEEMEKPLT